MNAGSIECLGNFLCHIVEAGHGMEAGITRFRETALIHGLGLVLRTLLDFACDQYDGRSTTIGRDQRCTALGQTWAASDHGDAYLAGGASVAFGH